MQAALEAMQVYGFSEDLILKKLKELLNVYGEDNWFFIEENSYKVLLDNILEEEEQQKDDTLAGPSTATLPPPHSDAEALEIALPASEALESAPQTYGTSGTALVSYDSDCDDRLPMLADGTGQKDLNLEQNSGEQQHLNILKTSDKDSGSVDPFGDTNLSPPHAIHSEQPKHTVRIRKRRPYNGWISNDDEVNEECFIKLEPSPLPVELAKLLFGTNIRSSRKKRWDLRPEDPV